MAKDWQAVADAINARMDELGISQVELANRARVAVATLRQIQHAVPKDRNPRTLAAISEALKMPPQYLEKVAAREHGSERSPDRVEHLESEVADLRARVEELERHITPPAAE